MAGHRVIEGGSSREALEILGREKVDAVVAALDLPDAGGYKLLDGMRSRLELKDIPVVALASKPEDMRPRGGSQPDFRSYTLKFASEQTLRAIEEAAEPAGDADCAPAA